MSKVKPIILFGVFLTQHHQEQHTEAPNAIKNSYHLISKLNGTFFSNCKLVSFDVVSLFTNVPHE